MMNLSNLVKKYQFTDIPFELLMQKRIYKVLLICSTYDAYMLEEDGRIDDRLFEEYVSLNLRYPPIFVQAHTEADAFNVLEQDNIDMIITMLDIDNFNAFCLAKKIKAVYADKPIVVLTPFSREVTLQIEKEDISAIDYVFCWLGNTDLLLAIIKLIEDKMNLKHDVEEIGVQTIILVEDSIRYYSSYLPNIYKIIFMQSKISMTEAINEHQQMLSMRGRPKILLATNYEEAISLIEKYKTNILGIISDISYNRNGKLDTQAGIKLCKKVRTDDPHMPFLLQSSDIKNETIANELKVWFINKYSKNLSIELRDFITQNLAFGDFIFRNPINLKEVDRASNLKSLQAKILTIPEASLEFHAKNNHISKWLNARGLFPIAQFFKYISFKDFENIEDGRKFIYQAISNYRKSRSKGVIAKFNQSSFDNHFNFTRIGDGSIGGKARGLAYTDMILRKYNLYKKFENVKISIPKSVVLSTEVFDEFMDSNNLYPIALSKFSDKEILKHFIEAHLPSRFVNDLETVLTTIKNPLAIRSSSKLEDSHYQPFAGIYATYMIPNLPNDRPKMLKMLKQAIKSIYASVFYKSSKAYMTATSNVIDEEKMGIVIQEVCGSQYGTVFYPTISGVARSINFYPIYPEKPEEGIANIAFGLGKYIVDGGISLRFSPKYPRKILQLSSPEMALKNSQKQFNALSLLPKKFVPSTNDGVNILNIDIKEATNDYSLSQVASTFDYENHMLRDGSNEKGMRLITFSNILQYNTFPLAEILTTLLEIGQKEMSNPIEIEFAVNLNVPEGCPKIFNFLQIRPIVENKEIVNLNLLNATTENTIIYSKSALGNGIIDTIYDIVYVKPESFNPAYTLKIAETIEKINIKFVNKVKNYILVGPGRWGSSDPWLGIPVKWSQISAARVIVESSLENFQIDPSQGTHFFQNLTSFRVGYFTINPFIKDGSYDTDFLSKQKSIYEDQYIKHIQFDKPVIIKIDGKNNIGIIYKPD